MKETLSLTSLKFWHPPGCCVTLLTRRQTRGGVKKRRCRHPEIKTQLSSPTQKNDFLSAIRHINWWVRVLKMVVNAAGWDQDNERLCVGPHSCHFDEPRFMSHQSGLVRETGSQGQRLIDVWWKTILSSQTCEVVTWPGDLTLLKFDNKQISSPLWK